MWTLPTRLFAIAAVTLLLNFPNQSAFARGSQVGHDDPWNSEHIERLPPEVRNAVVRMCADPRAGHYFATYCDNSHLLKLHFEHLHCDEQTTFCKGSSCLHQEYLSTSGRFRLIKSYYGTAND